MVVTKIDLLPFLKDVSLEAISDSVGRVMPRPRVIAVSAQTNDGIAEWIEWLGGIRTAVDDRRSPHAVRVSHAPVAAAAKRRSE